MNFIYAVIGIFIVGPAIWWLLEFPHAPTRKPVAAHTPHRAIWCNGQTGHGGSRDKGDHTHYSVAAMEQCHQKWVDSPEGVAFREQAIVHNMRQHGPEAMTPKGKTEYARIIAENPQQFCTHLSAVPVDLYTGERAAWLCPDCGKQLPEDFRPSAGREWVRHGKHKGARVTDARTGEIIGYWKPRAEREAQQ